jgi:hypothetical protein
MALTEARSALSKKRPNTAEDAPGRKPPAPVTAIAAAA